MNKTEHKEMSKAKALEVYDQITKEGYVCTLQSGIDGNHSVTINFGHGRDLTKLALHANRVGCFIESDARALIVFRQHA